MSEAAFSKTFRCPEDLPNDQARKDALKTFLVWAGQRDTNITVTKIVELRTRLLEEHHCEKTLANIRQSELPPGASRYQCTAQDRSRHFTDQKDAGCVAVPIEDGWVNLISQPQALVDVLPSGNVKEDDGTKIWTQFYLAEPVSTEDGLRQYNHVKGVTKYYCKSKQQRLIQADYWLNDRLVLRTSSANSVIEEIEPGTLAETIYEYACKK
ncbi:MAG: hypothetical protein JWR16_334 [Nevskia sp.]|nr:hypothetical protein [Nevskia sp.]